MAKKVKAKPSLSPDYPEATFSGWVPEGGEAPPAPGLESPLPNTTPKKRGPFLSLKTRRAIEKSAPGLAKGAVGVALISYLLQSGQELVQELIRSKAEAGQMDLAQMAYSPENVQQQAMLPINRSQKQAALYMLLQKMGGGGGRPMLADGESLT